MNTTNSFIFSVSKTLPLLLALFCSYLGYSQNWTHDFESIGGYTTSHAECTDGANDYFIRTDGSNINDAPSLAQGSFFFAAQDIDAAGCPVIPSANATMTFEDIDISGCSGLSLEVLAATFNTSGWDDNDFVHIYYDIDNSGSWSNLIWFENDGAAFNSVAMVDTDFDGTGDGATLGNSFQNISAPITGTGALVDLRIEFQLNSDVEDFALDNLRIYGAGCGVPSVTITTGPITTAPFTVDCSSSGDNGTVDFVSTGVFNPSNNYTAQLSDENGSFASPLNIGTFSSTANSGSISFTLPANLASGTSYLIRVVSDAPSAIGSSSSAFEINQIGNCGIPIPSSSGLIINEWSNGPNGNKEYYEFVVAGACGESVDIRGFILDDNNATFTNPSDYSSNASGIAGGHFRFSYTAQWASIPVGSLIVIYNADDPNPELPTDDPSDANNDSLYVVPHNNSLFERCTSMPASASPDSIYTPCSYATAPLTGWGPLSLRNSGDAIQVRNPDGSYYHGVSYGGSEITGGPHNLKLFTGSGSASCGWFNDGDFFDASNWSSGSTTGNQTPGLPNNASNLAWLQAMRDPSGINCPVTILPVEISHFSGHHSDLGNELHWTTESERNSSHFTIERSVDGKKWEDLGTVKSMENSISPLQYQFLDINYGSNFNYYRLKQFDLDGSLNTYNKTVVIDNEAETSSKLIVIYNLLGQEVDQTYKGVQIHIFSDGTSKKILKY